MQNLKTEKKFNLKQNIIYNFEIFNKKLFQKTWIHEYTNFKKK